MAPRSTIRGLAALDRKLRRLPEAVTAEIKAEMEAVADDIVRMARSLAPEDDGALRRSIGWTWGAPPRGSLTLGKVARSALGKQLTITIYAGNDEAFYARWVEFGTAPHLNKGLYPGTHNPGTAAQPFFYPSWRASKKDARKRMRQSLRRGAKKVAAGG